MNLISGTLGRYSFSILLLIFSGPSLFSGNLETGAGDTAVPNQEFLVNLLNTKIGIFTLGNLLLCFGIILLTLVIRSLLVRILFDRLNKMAARTTTEYDDRLLNSLQHPASTYLLFLGFFLAIGTLPLDGEVYKLLVSGFKGATTVIVFWGLIRCCDVMADLLQEMTARRGHSISAFIPLFKKAVRAFLIIVGCIMVIDNLGYSVGGILATLGLGGAAFAFASKDTIANLYGSLALALDRPFKVGDWIMVGDKVDGDVEEIGLRSTKVRTWPKTVLSIPNSVLANEMINNWSRMPKRRVKQVIGITYETSADDMDGLVEDFRRLLGEDDGVQQEFILVNFTDFGESSLNILVYYFTKSTQWLEHMDVRQRINLKIIRAVKARGLAFAFPSRSLYLEGKTAQKLAGLQNSGDLPNDIGPDSPF